MLWWAKMVRIIALREKNCRWSAYWHDDPSQKFKSGSVLGAIARLLIHSPDRHVASSDLVTDPMACQPGHVEMVVWEQPACGTPPLSNDSRLIDPSLPAVTPPNPSKWAV